ncbi:MAG: TIGR01212 family radical SAM protein [Pirellulales bacterium]|nr:TIGR01212 family radical SAM protein [Pirellulales bacterium]
MVSSTESRSSAGTPADWRSAGLLYHSRSFFFRKQFGQRVWKVSVDAGFGCPNRDGTCGTGGCIFCDPVSFSPSRRLVRRSVTAQLDEGIRRLRARHRVDRFVAYFQPATNTYAPVGQLEHVFREALAHRDVAGLMIGTRPDCVPDDVLDLLAELSRQTWLSVEYGLQTIHDRTLDWMKRGHRYEAFLDAHRRSRQRELTVGAHVILGLPGESPADMRATALQLARLRIDAVKIHNLHAVRDTRLAELVAAGVVRLPQLAEYVAWVVDLLEYLPPSCVIDRLSGDAPPQYLVGPAWCGDKSAVRLAVESELKRRNTWQGRKHAE